MKRPKKAIAKATTYTGVTYSLICPHCKTELQGSINTDILRLACWECKNPIDIQWGGKK